MLQIRAKRWNGVGVDTLSVQDRKAEMTGATILAGRRPRTGGGRLCHVSWLALTHKVKVALHNTPPLRECELTDGPAYPAYGRVCHDLAQISSLVTVLVSH